MLAFRSDSGCKVSSSFRFSRESGFPCFASSSRGTLHGSACAAYCVSSCSYWQCLRKWCYWLEITTLCFSWVVRRSNCSPKTRFSWCSATASRTQRCICSKRCTSEWTWTSCICPTLRTCGTIERSFRSTRISRGQGRYITSWGAFSKEKAGTRLI